MKERKIVPVLYVMSDLTGSTVLYNYNNVIQYFYSKTENSSLRVFLKYGV